MNAPIASHDITAASVVEIEPDLAGDWPALLVLAHVRMAGLIRDNCELRARLGLLPPLLADWAEYDRWAAAAREYHADRKRRRR
jgi:hypothetical protein